MDMQERSLGEKRRRMEEVNSIETQYERLMDLIEQASQEP